MRFLTLLTLFLTHFGVFTQVFDPFSDGDFIINPSWNGTSSDFIVNNNGQLQLNSLISNSSYLTLEHQLVDIHDKEWRFKIKHAFSGSGNNFGRVYLCSDDTVLTSNPQGFYLQFGESGSDDAIRLMRNNGTQTVEVLSGLAGQIANSFELGIKVVRDDLGNWELFIDENAGENYSLVATGTDTLNLVGSYFGFLCTYTISNSTDFYYDDVYIGPIEVDEMPPVLTHLEVVNDTQIALFFNEILDGGSVTNLNNYLINPEIGISSAVLDNLDESRINLVLTEPLVNGVSYFISVNGVQDEVGNTMEITWLPLQYLVGEEPEFSDVIINEFLCDPTPTVSLPEVDFVELYNKSDKVFNLEGWSISDANSSGTIDAHWLLPNSMVVLTNSAFVDDFENAIPVTGFPNFNNSGDAIILKDSTGFVLNEIHYTDDWYQDEDKANGGFSIERINPNHPCSGASNWRASDHIFGGTPGSYNSVFNTTPDTQAPSLLSVTAEDDYQIEVLLDEAVDSLVLTNVICEFSPELSVDSIIVTGTESHQFTIVTAESITTSTVYEITVNNANDCWGNVATLNGTFLLPDEVLPGDLLINEILFDPESGGKDWIELYNNSDKVLDTYGWELANFTNDSISNHETIEQHYYLQPGTYIFLSEDTNSVQLQYPFHGIGRSLQTDLPNYNNGAGSVIVIANNEIIDRVDYQEDWHFSLLESTKGKSLERLSFSEGSNKSDNWHTAAETVEFGTPGRVNSQYISAVNSGSFELNDDVISPDNDGFQDILAMSYQLEKEGMVGTLAIYDQQGRLIDYVFRNELLSPDGVATWDGTDQVGQKVKIGVYIVLFEAFDQDGSVIYTNKKAFTVAGILN